MKMGLFVFRLVARVQEQAGLGGTMLIPLGKGGVKKEPPPPPPMTVAVAASKVLAVAVAASKVLALCWQQGGPLLLVQLKRKELCKHAESL
jgi:hypothetical protein